MIRVIRGNKGFSLIEVLIGVVFLAIGVLAVAGMQAASVRGNFSSNNVMLATYVAHDRLEFLKNTAITNSLLTLGTHNDGTATISTSSFTSLAFNRSYNVIQRTDVNGNNYLEIDYLVTWNDGVGHSIPFNTFRSQ